MTPPVMLWPEITHLPNLWLVTVPHWGPSVPSGRVEVAVDDSGSSPPPASVIASVTSFCLDQKRKKHPVIASHRTKLDPLRQHLKLIHLLKKQKNFLFSSPTIVSRLSFLFFLHVTLCFIVLGDWRWRQPMLLSLCFAATKAYRQMSQGCWRDGLEQRCREPISTQVGIFTCLVKALNGDELIPCAICHLSHMSRIKESDRERKKKISVLLGVIKVQRFLEAVVWEKMKKERERLRHRFILGTFSADVIAVQFSR